MTKKKNKFDLTQMVNKGFLKDGQTLYFVSDPSKSCQIKKQPNGECKVTLPNGKVETIHSFATACLGTEPPMHATKWLRTQDGKMIYDLWQSEDDMAQAA